MGEEWFLFTLLLFTHIVVLSFSWMRTVLIHLVAVATLVLYPLLYEQFFFYSVKGED